MMRRERRQNKRNRADEDLFYRSLGIRANNDGPSTVDREARSVDVVAATENPVMVFDYDRWEVVPEVLLMSGCKLPKNRQVPLLDSHSRFSSGDVIGSARQLQIEGGELIARAFFSSVAPAPDIFRKVDEGHLTDFSIGYRVNKSIWVPAGQAQVIKGRNYQGPVKVATDWTPRELSTTPIGADEMAKARSDRQNRSREVHVMLPEWLKIWLEGRGLFRDGMTEDEARKLFEQNEMKRVAPVAPVAPVAEPPVVPAPARSEDQVRAEERNRVLEIRAMGDRFELPELAETLIVSGRSLEDARKEILDKLTQKTEPGRAFRPAVEMQTDERDKFRSAAQDSILIRLGFVDDMSKAAPGANTLVGYSLRELARECLKRANQPVDGNVLQMVGRALVTSDLPYLLAAGANKSMLRGWNAQDTTYQIWCGIETVPDFKTFNLINISEADDLDEVPEGAKYNYGDLRDSREQAALLTYGKIFAVTRQAIVNDDLNGMMKAPMIYGRSARRKVNGLAYGILTTNGNMADGVALLHSTHANVGTSGVISTTTIGEGFAKMRLQKGIKALEPLNIVPKFLVAPVTLEASAEAFFNTIQIANAAGNVLLNEYAGNRITRVYDPVLDGTDTTDWYLAADKGMTVNVYFLEGQTEPFLDEQQGWTVDGVEYKVRIDAVAKAVDWRGLFLNEGGS